jgi:hypothetical protein
MRFVVNRAADADVQRGSGLRNLLILDIVPVPIFGTTTLKSKRYYERCGKKNK